MKRHPEISKRTTISMKSIDIRATNYGDKTGRVLARQIA